MFQLCRPAQEFYTQQSWPPSLVTHLLFSHDRVAVLRCLVATASYNVLRPSLCSAAQCCTKFLQAFHVRGDAVVQSGLEQSAQRISFYFMFPLRRSFTESDLRIVCDSSKITDTAAKISMSETLQASPLHTPWKKTGSDFVFCPNLYKLVMRVKGSNCISPRLVATSALESSWSRPVSWLSLLRLPVFCITGNPLFLNIEKSWMELNGTDIQSLDILEWDLHAENRNHFKSCVFVNLTFEEPP